MVIDSFLYFLTRYDEKKACDVLVLMLDSIFKSLRLMFSSIGHEHGVTITLKIDRKSLFFMLLKSYHHLHPLPKAKSYFVYKNDEDNNLDIFEIVVVNSELHHKLLISPNFNKICMKIIKQYVCAKSMGFKM